MCRASDGRRAEVWIGAMCFMTADRDFRQAITFAGAHWLQRGWLAHNRVTRMERFGRGQTFRAQTANLFVAGKDKRERLLEFRAIDVFDGGQRRGDERFRVARTTAE